MSPSSVQTPWQAKKFPRDELIDRAFRRAARVILEWHQESDGFCPTRILDNPLIPDEYVIVGESTSGNQCREHVVPLKIICDEVPNICKQNMSEGDVAKFLRDHVQIVLISQDERNRLDRAKPLGLGLRQSMPEGWSFADNDVYARLSKANIKWNRYQR